jgi:hypothetical protein
MLRPSTTKGTDWGHDHGELMMKIEKGKATALRVLCRVANISS